MEITDKEIFGALSSVMDPDLKRDLVSLGMIEDVKTEGKKVTFKVVLTTPACPLKNKIRQDCIDAIHRLSSELIVEPEMTSRVSTQKAVPSEKQRLPGVKNIIAVVSGKGGVGKSTVASNLAVALAMTGSRTGLVDADIYGPSVPLMFGLEDAKPEIFERDGKPMMKPLVKYGVKLNSIGFLVDAEKALIWRGPMASSAMKQIISDTDWEELDYLIIDTPPGTGDIHLTLAQTYQMAGIAIVTTPQQVALADALKAVNMFRQDGIRVPVLGLIENMSWFTPAELPDNRYFIFGKDGGTRLAEACGLPLLGQIPVVQGICESGDQGVPVALDSKTKEGKAFLELAQAVSQQISIWNAFTEMTDVKPCK